MRACITRRIRGWIGLWKLTIGMMTVCLPAAPAAIAAPPEVTSLFPAGLRQGSTRTLKINGKLGTTPVHSWCSTDGLHVALADSGEELTVTAADDVPPGLHWIRLFNAEGASQLLPIFVGVIAETTEAEFDNLDNDDSTASGALPVTISGVLSKSGEVDAFPVALKQGQTLVASIESHRSLGAPADMVMQLVSEAGFVLDQNDDFHGFDPQIVFTARQSEEFVVRLFAFPAEPNSTIRFAGGSDYAYRLTLTTGPFVDHCVPLSLSSNEPTNVRCFGWSLPEDHDLSPATVAEFPGTIGTERNQQIPQPTAVEEPRGQTEFEQTIPLGTALTGHIASPGESDTYAFEADKDQRLRVSASARSYGSPLDPVVRILDADGTVIKEADDLARENVDAQLDVKFPAKGTYRAVVTDRFGHGGMRYVYELRIEEERPRFALTLKEDRFTLNDGKPIEIPVAIERQGGFAEEITVTLRGLPEGVSVEPTISAPKGDSSKEVKLKLEADASVAFSGPVEIIGVGPENSEVVATTPTPTAAMTTPSLWLTVVPTPDQSDDSDP